MTDLDFEALFAVLPSPYMVVDRNLDYVAVNAAYEKAMMRSRSELIGGHVFSLFPDVGEGGRRVRQSMMRVLETGQADTIAYIPYEIPMPPEEGGGSRMRYWTAIHTPLDVQNGRANYVMQNTVEVTELVMLQEAASMPFRTMSGHVELIQRAQEAERAYAASMSQSADFKRLFQQAPGMIAVLQGPEHVVTFANDAYGRFIGGRDVVGCKLRDALPEIDGQGFIELLDGVYEKGVPYIGEGVRIVIQQEPGQAPQNAYLDFSYHPIRDVEGRTTGVFVQGMDRTAHFLALQRQRLLVDELNHRVKNTLSTVQSIARQTFRGEAMKLAREAFEARVVALSKAHNILSERLWDVVKLSTLLQQELAAFAPERVEIEGPDLYLSPKAAIAFAMIFHELASNAARFGAMSSDSGGVAVAWSRLSETGPGTLVLTWRESGGPPVIGPVKRGFGMRMLQRIVEGEFDGALHLDLSPAGFMFEMKISMSEVEESADGRED